MARDSSGVYTNALPDVVSGDVIEAAWANTTIDDIGAEIQDSLSRSGKGNMSVPLKVVAGSVSAPGLSFVSEANSGLYRSSAADIRMALNSAEAWRVTTAGFRVPADITLGNGNVIVGTAAKGIDFSAQTPTAATGATTTAEILNHYEAGTWTPNLWDTSNSSSESQAYAQQSGRFTRIGNKVFIEGYIEMSAIGTLSGEARIGPLPYTSVSSAPFGTVQVGLGASFDASVENAVTGYIPNNVNYIALYVWNSVGATELMTITKVSASGELIFSGSYTI